MSKNKRGDAPLHARFRNNLIKALTDFARFVYRQSPHNFDDFDKTKFTPKFQHALEDFIDHRLIHIIKEKKDQETDEKVKLLKEKLRQNNDMFVVNPRAKYTDKYVNIVEIYLDQIFGGEKWN